MATPTLVQLVNLTFSLEITLSDGYREEFVVPPFGQYQTFEARQLAVMQMIELINVQISPRLSGISASRTKDIDTWLLDSDTTNDFSRLTPEVAFAISYGVCRASLHGNPVLLKKHFISQGLTQATTNGHSASMVVPIFSGDPAHETRLASVDFCLIPSSRLPPLQAFAMLVKIHEQAKRMLELQGEILTYRSNGCLVTPNAATISSTIQTLKLIVTQAGYGTSKDVFFGLKFYPELFFKSGRYRLGEKQSLMDAAEYKAFLAELLDEESILYVANFAAQTNEEIFQEGTAAYGGRMYLGSTDFSPLDPAAFSGNLERDFQLANLAIFTPQQFGTVSLLAQRIQIARSAKQSIMFSYAEIEVDDPYLSELANAFEVDFVSCGPLASIEYVRKYENLVSFELPKPQAQSPRAN